MLDLFIKEPNVLNIKKKKNSSSDFMHQMILSCKRKDYIYYLLQEHLVFKRWLLCVFFTACGQIKQSFFGPML